MQGVYIAKFDFKIRKIFISLGHTPTNGIKFGVEESTFGQISPHRCRVSPLRGEKKLKIVLTQLNNSALRAMLAVIAGRAPGRIHSNVPFNQKGSVIAEQAEEENQG